MGDFDGFDNLKTGYKKIDHQHKKIFEYIENLQKLNKKILHDQNDYELKKKVDVFIEYFYNHLYEEEKLMEEANYDLYDDHLKEHDK